MVTFIGEYNCKIDPKGRLMLPVAFKKQMPGGNQDRYVIKKSIYVKCLDVYPYDEWEKECQKLVVTNKVADRDTDMFIRLYTRGAAELILDANNRLLLPKRLLDQIDADKDVVMAGRLGKMEIWTKEIYDNLEVSDEEFSRLAEKVLKGRSGEN